jgi:hypothetical protein
VKWYRNQNEIALDEILSRTSDATLRVLWVLFTISNERGSHLF